MFARYNAFSEVCPSLLCGLAVNSIGSNIHLLLDDRSMSVST